MRTMKTQTLFDDVHDLRRAILSDGASADWRDRCLTLLDIVAEIALEVDGRTKKNRLNEAQCIEYLESHGYVLLKGVAPCDSSPS